jgi:tryptophan-rich sensory protein
LINVFIPFIVGISSHIVIQLCSGSTASRIYIELSKPSFAPNETIFFMCWTVVLIMLGISAFMAFKNDCNVAKTKDAMFYYTMTLVLSFLWGILFFGFNFRFSALVCLLMIIITFIFLIIKFSRVNRRSGYINLINLVIILYIGFINYFLWILN